MLGYPISEARCRRSTLGLIFGPPRATALLQRGKEMSLFTICNCQKKENTNAA